MQDKDDEETSMSEEKKNVLAFFKKEEKDNGVTRNETPQSSRIASYGIPLNAMESEIINGALRDEPNTGAIECPRTSEFQELMVHNNINGTGTTLFEDESDDVDENGQNHEDVDEDEDDDLLDEGINAQTLSAWLAAPPSDPIAPGAVFIPGIGREENDQNQESEPPVTRNRDNLIDPYQYVADCHLAQARLTDRIPIATPVLRDPRREPPAYVSLLSSSKPRVVGLFLCFLVVMIAGGLLITNRDEKQLEKQAYKICDASTNFSEFQNRSHIFKQVGSTIYPEHDDEIIGSSISLCSDGRHVALGSNSQRGHYVTIYHESNGTWALSDDLSQDLPPSLNELNGETEVAFSGDCNLLAVGIPTHDVMDGDPYGTEGRIDRGTFVVFQHTDEGNKWDKLGYADVGNYAWHAQVGRGIRISGNGNKVIFSQGRGGKISVFGIKNTNTSDPKWEIIFSTDVEDQFVNVFPSVSIDHNGTKIAVGLSTFDSNAGKVTIYDISKDKVYTVHGSEGDMFGGSVELSNDGNRVVVGTQTSNDPNMKSKNDYVRVLGFSEQSKDWIPVGEDICGKNKITSLCEKGDRIAIGSPQNTNGLGNIRVYDLQNGSWKQVGETIYGNNLNDETGFSISLSSNGKFIAFGAPGTIGLGKGQGKVEVYEVRNNGGGK